MLIAVGAQEGIRLPIPGNDLDGVHHQHRLSCTTCAWRICTARAVTTAAAAAVDPRARVEGKDVVVVGGGDVAVDVARSSLRLGAREVRMAVRGSSGGMPASAAEQKAARDEGIEIEIGLNFLEVLDDGQGRVAGLECERVASFETGPDGKRRTITVEPIPSSSCRATC